MNKNIRTITILKVLFKRPLVFIGSIFTRITQITAKGIMQKLFKLLGLIVFFFLKLKKYSVDRNKIANLTYSYNIYAILSIDGHKLHEILFIQNLKLK